MNEFDPHDPGIPARADRPALDRWVLSRLATTIEAVTVGLDTYEPFEAASPIVSLVGDLSNWYVRRSRRRFWRTDPNAPADDTLSAHATLHEVLATLSVLLAPFCPFVADRMWRELTGADEADSVHLADWPVPDNRTAEAGGPVDIRLETQMALARRLTSLGRAARSEAGVKVRQPLARALVFMPSGAPDILPLVVEEELNVDEVVVAQELGDVLRFELVPNFKLLGPRLGDLVKGLKPALAKLDGVEAAATLEAGQPITIDLGQGPVELGPDDIELRVQGQQGFTVSREGGEVVALELTLNEDLIHRGVAREVVRRVQDLRKDSGLEVSDRITLWLDGLDAIAYLFDLIASEVLATEIVAGPGQGPGTDLELGEEFPEARAWLKKA